MRMNLRIGPHGIAVEAAREPGDGIRAAWQPFLDDGRGRPELLVRIQGGMPRKAATPDLISTHPGHWRLLQYDGGWWLEFLDQVGFHPKQVILLDATLREADLYIPPLAREREELASEGWHLADVMMPFLQWWLTTWSGLHGIGLILHAAAVDLHHQGLVFAGPSGSGKTTAGHLLQDLALAHLLNDERVYIWREASGWNVTGTPWHGSHPTASARQVPLARLCVLTQAQINHWQALSPGALLARLLPEAFLPRWNAEAMEGLIETVARLVEDVPCGELCFTKDARFVAFLRGLLALNLEPTSTLA